MNFLQLEWNNNFWDIYIAALWLEKENTHGIGWQGVGAVLDKIFFLSSKREIRLFVTFLPWKSAKFIIFLARNKFKILVRIYASKTQFEFQRLYISLIFKFSYPSTYSYILLRDIQHDIQDEASVVFYNNNFASK